MPLFEWTEKLDVNVQSFNDQHRRLVDLINHLHTAMSEGKGHATMAHVLGELANYTMTHFAAEEKLMAEKAYPGMAAHVAEHKAFVAKVEDLMSRFEKGAVALSIETSNFLKDWLVNHIQGTDKQYGPFFNGVGVH